MARLGDTETRATSKAGDISRPPDAPGIRPADSPHAGDFAANVELV
jgi:hypothetical protein